MPDVENNDENKIISLEMLFDEVDSLERLRELADRYLGQPRIGLYDEDYDEFSATDEAMELDTIVYCVVRHVWAGTVDSKKQEIAEDALLKVNKILEMCVMMGWKLGKEVELSDDNIREQVNKVLEDIDI